MTTAGELEKMMILAYEDIKYGKVPDEMLKTTAKKSVTVMFNPSTYTRKYEVEYGAAQGAGTSNAEQKFCSIKPQELTFEFVFDGTGAAGEKKDVETVVQEFLDCTYGYQGEIHRPYYLVLLWGTLLFKCVLKSADVTYTLFTAAGRPLRAKVTALFAENIDDKTRVKTEDNQSPDLTKFKVVKKGDTLPLLAYELYGDPSYYIDLAEVNKLDNFRRLEEGTLLVIPPVKSA